ncbi:MAG: type III secretion system chaperone [Pseudomonadota bacterium]
MKLPELMKELAEALRIEEFALEDDGGAQIVIDTDYVIDIEKPEDSAGFDFSATVCPAPKENTEAVFAELLKANLTGQGTGGGGALALDTVLGEIVLSHSVRHDDLTYEAFETELELFVKALRYWRGRFEGEQVGLGLDDTKGPEDNAAPSMPGTFV